VNPGRFCHLSFFKRPFFHFLFLLLLASAGHVLASEGTYEHGYRAVAVDVAGRRVVALQDEAPVLELFDLDSRALIASVTLPARGTDLALDEAAALAVVSHDKHDRISLIDLAGATVTHTLAVGEDPHGVAVDVTRRLALVANAHDDTVSLVDLSQPAVIQTLAVGDKPRHVALHPGLGLAVVSHEKGDSLSFIDLDLRAVTATVAVADKPGALAVDRMRDRALVVHEKADLLSVVDLATGGIVATLDVGKSPRGVAAAGDRAVVANEKDDSLQRIDLATLEVTGVLGTGRNPHDVALAGDLAIVANEKADVLDYLDLTAAATPAQAAVGRDPHGVAVHSGLDLAVVANKKDDTVTLLALPDGAPVATLVVGRDPYGAVVPAGRGEALVTLKKDDALAIIDLAGPAVAATVPVGRAPHGVAVDAAGGRAAVANKKDDTVSLIDLASRQVIATLATGEEPRDVAFDPGNGQLLVALEEAGVLQRLDPETGTVLASIPVGAKPRAVAVHGGLRLAAVVNKKADSLTLVDLAADSVLATLPVGEDPVAVAIDEAGRRALVVNHHDDTVTRVDLANRVVTATLTVGKHPHAAAFTADGTLAVVSHEEGDSVTLLRFAPADTTPPAITLTSATLTNQAAYTLRGVLDEAATLTVNGAAVIVAADLRFQHDLTLSEGANVLQLTATDGAGNATVLDFTVTLDNTPPAAPDPGLIQIGPPDAAGQVTVSGSAGAVEPGATVTVTNLRTGESVTVSAEATGAFSATLGGRSGDRYRIVVEDAAGNTGAATEGVGLPPDPAAIAPALDPTVASDLYSATAFLYSGPNAVQIGVAPGTIEPRRAAVIRGRVLDRNDMPLAGVTITVKDHPEYGYTLSRADGRFDLAVNGGGMLVLHYEKPGHLPVQRRVNTPWRDYTWAEDVVLIPLDATVTSISSGSAVFQVARGSVVADGDGSRQATLLFPPGTTAELVLADGSRQALTQWHVRATEYTVGDNGPQAMPGELPPASGYTYAVELSADEAIAAGARRVAFNQPVIFYLENFLGFPTGEPVPTGWYDLERAIWMPSDNGRVIEILAIEGGLAALDIDGDGTADDAPALAALGITDGERAELAALYVPGQSLWRVLVTHFTPWDCNWSFFDDVEKLMPPETPAQAKSQNNPDTPCSKAGCIVLAESQVLGEDFPLTGSPMTLHYRSDRSRGNKSDRTMTLFLSGSALNATVQEIELSIQIAGRTIRQTFPPLPDQTFTFEWDGLDAYGRLLQGSHPARVTVRYQLQVPVYYCLNQGGEIRQRFGRPCFRSEKRIATRYVPRSTHRHWEVMLRAFEQRNLGLGGFSLSAHHFYDPVSRTLYRGDGRRTTAANVGHIINAVVGGGAGRDLVAAPDGSLYYLAGNQVLRMRPDGVVEVVAGTGSSGNGGDGGPALAAQLNSPTGLALGVDGSLYIADSGNHGVRKVSPDGVITTVAGTGVLGDSGDEGPAVNAGLLYLQDVAMAPDGNLYIATLYRIRRVAPDGTITTVAGTGTGGHSGDGGPANQARLTMPRHLVLDEHGNLYFTDMNNHVVRRVTPDGIITTVAGSVSPLTGPQAGYSGDGGPATAALLDTPTGLALGPDGSLYIADRDNHRIRRITPDGIITTVAGTGALGNGGDGGPALQASIQSPGAPWHSVRTAFYICRPTRVQAAGSGRSPQPMAVSPRARSSSPRRMAMRFTALPVMAGISRPCMRSPAQCATILLMTLRVAWPPSPMGTAMSCRSSVMPRASPLRSSAPTASVRSWIWMVMAISHGSPILRERCISWCMGWTACCCHILIPMAIPLPIPTILWACWSGMNPPMAGVGSCPGQMNLVVTASPSPAARVAAPLIRWPRCLRATISGLSPPLMGLPRRC